MSMIQSDLLLGAPAGGTGYQIERSLRFNSSDSAYLSRTFGSAGNRKTWTWAAWVKRSVVGSGDQMLFSTGTAGATTSAVIFFRNDSLAFSTVAADILATSALFRDPSAWYHFVVLFDSTQASASARLRFFVNGSEISQFSTDARSAQISQNTDYGFNLNQGHEIGRFTLDSSRYFSGYLADIHFIDGQALTPSSFAETNTTTGQWVPKAYTGTYGTNGFRLAFADNSNNTATTLGKDSSGNGNNWTPNNLSVTAGAGNDSLVDTPTSYGTNTGAGGSVRGNYATLNPLAAGVGVTLANGNLDVTTSAAASCVVTGTFGMSAGKWYFEVTVNAGSSQYFHIGIAKNNAGLSSSYLGQDANGWGYGALTGQIYNNSIATNYGNTWSAGDIIGVAFDADAGNLYFYKNGTIQNSGTAAFTGLTSGPYLPAVSDTGNPFTINGTLNFGQRPFAYTAPSGFKALCDTNLPPPVVAKPNTVMDVLLWTGNNSARSITGLNFNPDLVWIKGRSGATDHALYDVVRGTEKRLESNTTDAEVTSDGGVTAFNSDGFSLGTLAQVNTNSSTYVGWAFDGGTSTVTNTQGSITSQVRANASAGFSIVTYTGTSSSQSVGHGLNVAPSLIITKNRSAALSWGVYHSSLGANNYLVLDVTNAVDNAPGVWGTVNSSVFGIGNFNINGKSNPYVAYCFAPVAGYSSFGSYTGNGSTDGPFVYTGFRPRWIIIKSSSIGGASGYDWIIHDTSRSVYNLSDTQLIANSSVRENQDSAGNSTSGFGWDILSNGFKIRTSAGGRNQSGQTYIYAAFAENPFQYARAR